MRDRSTGAAIDNAADISNGIICLEHRWYQKQPDHQYPQGVSAGSKPTVKS